MHQWRIRFSQAADTPDFIVAKAKVYWKNCGMTGFEAAETLRGKLLLGEI